jgi:hypothetical protein
VTKATRRRWKAWALAGVVAWAACAGVGVWTASHPSPAPSVVWVFHRADGGLVVAERPGEPPYAENWKQVGISIRRDACWIERRLADVGVVAPAESYYSVTIVGGDAAPPGWRRYVDFHGFIEALREIARSGYTSDQ